ncbi:MAG TPA: SDR family NAD(P)-dependent oxidoreductase [Egicoccus sp.]|nr:SDR family NAD(P)-dependent oxidoreductase [Egicoccus sp.]HSK24201.1 SDR family NAD(P)-dependent oxidoreductase [Egicoccus sp.]
MPIAIVTGASRGLGRAFAADLARAGWDLVVDARDATALATAAASWNADTRVVPVPGDVTHPAHRSDLASAAAGLGGLDLLVNNAGALGPSPLPAVAELAPQALRELWEVNVVAPLALIGRVLPLLRARRGAVVNLTSDAAVEAYPGWGGYGPTKVALDHAGRVLAVEEPDIDVYAFDPGDVRTDMHQAAFPDEDISDRADPGDVAPALRRLVGRRPPSGRYRAVEVLAVTEVGA